MDTITVQIQLLIEIFSTEAPNPSFVKKALQLKQEHTLRVAANCGMLALAAGCTARQIQLAQRIGWCHDLGRFLQFPRYQTFDDSKSIDHGQLSLKLIKGLQLDRDLKPEEKGIVWAAVLLHNRLELPGHLPVRTRFFSALLRDADRLDIFRIFADYYSQGPVADSPLELSYPDTGQISPAVLQAVLGGTSPSYRLGHSVQDMRLIKLSWAYTLETPGAAELFRTCGILEATRRVLPDTKDVHQALAAIDAWSLSASQHP